jgi:hypothetical protein
MIAFGVRFEVNNTRRYEALQSVYAEIKRDKDSGQFRHPAAWLKFVFDKLEPGDFRSLLALNLQRIFELIGEAKYEVLGCEMVSDGIAELQIRPTTYPYGGVFPLTALAQAFGFAVLGFNECGKYESCRR